MKYTTAVILLLLGIAFGDEDFKYNPDVDMTTPELIRKYGYPAESHTIETDDGYLLTLHRIPNYNSSTIPVFMQHGLLGSSSSWILNGPNKSLPYLLADLGYDVWFGNARGNTYSRSHVSLSIDDPKFWHFSFHEMGIHDLPAGIDYVLNVTGHEKLFYIGHSMGTTMFYVMASTRPEYNDKIQLMVSLAPVAFMGHVKSPIRLLTPFTRDLEFISRYLGEGEFLPHNKILKWLGKFGCELLTTEERICEDSIFVLAGFDEAQFNMSLLPTILGHVPAGSSTRTIIHYAQEIRSGKFQQFAEKSTCQDENLKHFNSSKCYNYKGPQEYDLSKISVPIDLHYADNDWLASPQDVQSLSDRLKNKVGFTKVPFAKFNHVDFIWAKDVKKLVYQIVINKLKKFQPRGREKMSKR